MIVYYIGYIFTFLVLLRFSIYTIRGTMGSPSKSVEMARKLNQGKLSGPSWCLNNILFRKSEKIAFRESLARLASVRSNPCYSGHSGGHAEPNSRIHFFFIFSQDFEHDGHVGMMTPFLQRCEVHF